MKRPTRTRDVRAARQAKVLARLFGHGTSMPVGDEPEPAVEFDHFEGQKAPVKQPEDRNGQPDQTQP